MPNMPSQPWTQQDGEPNRWFLRFERFRMLGPQRKIEAAYQEERAETGQKSKRPTASWYRRAREWNWVKRAEAWDLHIARQAIAEAEEHRLAVLRTGYAQQHERVAALNQLAERLLSELDDRLWLRDVKGIGSGADFERVEILRFNGSLVSEVRAALADIAAEVGERIKRSELSGPNGGPIMVADLDEVRQKRWDAIQGQLYALSQDDTNKCPEELP